MRKRIYEIIEIPEKRDPLSTAYDVFMLIAIVALPAGIITAGYMSQIKKEQAEDEQNSGNK